MPFTTRHLRSACILMTIAVVLAGCAAPAPEADVPAPSPDAAGADDSVEESVAPDVDVTAPPEDATPTPAPIDVSQIPADLVVRVDATTGARGDEPAQIDRRFYGFNIADWDPEDYRPAPDPTFAAYLRALEPGILRWPSGHTSQEWVWERAPEADDGERERVLTAEHVEDFLRLCEEVGALPLIAVNTKTGSAEGAADLVRYVNVERGHGVVWWQIGNEPDHKDGLTSGPEEYADEFERFARAMRDVDPSIKLVGPEIMTGAHMLGSNGKRDWLTPILERVGGDVDAISWHYYPLDSNQESADSSARPTRENLLFQEEANDWRPAGLAFADEIFPHLKRVRDQHTDGAELWVTEIAEDSANGGAEGLVGTQAAALWTADILGRFAAHGTDALVKFVFKSGSVHRYTLLDQDMNPRPAYYVYWLFAREFGDRVVRAESDDASAVAAHAALRTDDGALAVVLVNKADREVRVALDVAGHAWSDAEQYTIRGEGYGATQVALNGARLDATNAESGDGVDAQPVDLATGVALPPASVTFVVLRA